MMLDEALNHMKRAALIASVAMIGCTINTADNWQRQKECADRSEKIESSMNNDYNLKWKTEGKELSVNRVHYNSKDHQCYAVVTWRDITAVDIWNVLENRERVSQL